MIDINDLAAEFAKVGIQAGLNQAAEVLAEFLANVHVREPDAYRDGIDDALCALVQHGATDPRKE